MKNPPRPNIGKMPERGEKITVKVGLRLVLPARVTNPYRRRFVWRIESKDTLASQETGERPWPIGRRGTATRREEGTTWVRGWDSEEARALQVAVALTT